MTSIVRQVGRHVGPPLRRTLASAAPATAPTGEQHTDTAPPRPVTEIPGPKIYPIVGSLPALITDKNYSIATLHKLWGGMLDRYGPIVRLVNPGMEPIVLIKDPDEAAVLNRATSDNPYRPPLASLKKLREDITDQYFEKKGGLLVEQDEEWWRVRSKAQIPMMKKQNVELYLGDMDAVTKDILDRISELQKKHGEMPSNFQEEFYKWALENVGVVAFNRRLGCLDPEPNAESLHLIHIVNTMFHTLAINEMGAHFWRIFPTSDYRKLKKCHHEFLSITDRNIMETLKQLEAEADARKNSDGGDDDTRELRLMEMLLLDPGLTHKDVVTFILDMVFAGIDTTSHTVAFALYLLAKNPKAQKTLQKEVDTVLEGHEGPLTKNHLARMSYLKAVIKETLRIYPLVMGMARILTNDLVLKGYNVTAGHIVFSLNMFLGWEEQYFPRAKEFLPERWLRHRPLGPIHPYAILPFGGGTRMCIGRRIAEQEMYILLARALQRYNIDYKYEDIGIETGLVFKPDKPLRFSFTERH